MHERECRGRASHSDWDNKKRSPEEAKASPKHLRVRVNEVEVEGREKCFEWMRARARALE